MFETAFQCPCGSHLIGIVDTSFPSSEGILHIIHCECLVCGSRGPAVTALKDLDFFSCSKRYNELWKGRK